MLELHAMASDLGPANLDFVSKGRFEYMRIRQSNIHGGYAECWALWQMAFLI